MTLIDSSNEEMGKMFVGGLSWKTSTDDLKQYFSQYGDIVDCIVMKNNQTGKSRGFGFITFEDPAVVSSVIVAGPHSLDGKTIDPKACAPRGQQRGKRDGAKVFIGGLSPNLTEDEIKTAFTIFGNVVDVHIMRDQETKKPRGFGFLSFESEDSMQQACAQRYVDVNGNQVECKPAMSRNNNFGGRDGNGGGGRMGYQGDNKPGMSWMRGGGASRYPSQFPQTGKPGNYGNNWGANAQPPYGAAGAVPYAASSYNSYNPVSSGYVATYSTPPSAGSAPTASDPYGAAAAPVYTTYVASQPSTVAPSATAGCYSSNLYNSGMSNYAQDPKAFYSTGTTPPANGGAGDGSYGYAASAQGYNSASVGSNQSNRPYAQPAYHPYRR